MDDIFDRSERDHDAQMSGGLDIVSLTSQEWRPLWWRAERIGYPSAWWTHVPFAHWLVHSVRPRCLVELGTHAGVSYAAFCQAVVVSGIETRCFAVDTWKGDRQAGEYDEDIYTDLSRYHDERYGAFSTLLRSTFDEALDKIRDGSVDVLHIDGLHTYDAVRADFEHWRPKLSRRGVVLFHDINEHRDDFGVWKMWAEVAEQYPSFEFLHGHGLGVLAVGEDVPPAVAALCQITDRGALASVRALFARLGERWEYETRERMLQRNLTEHVEAANRQAQVAKAHFEAMDAEMRRLRDAVERAEAEAVDAEAARRRAEEAEARHSETHVALRRLAESSEQARSVAEAAHSRSVATVEQHVASHRERERLAQALAQADAARQAALAERDALAARARRSDEQIAAREAELAALQAQIAERSAVVGHAEAARVLAERERDVLMSSTLWQATGPLRRIAHRMPNGARRLARRSAKLVWWSATLKLPARLRQRSEVLAQSMPGHEQQVSVRPPGPPDLAIMPEALAVRALQPGFADDHGPSPATAPAATAAAKNGPTGAELRVVWVSGEPGTPGHEYRVARHAAAAAAAGATVQIIDLADLPARRAELAGLHVLVLWRMPWSDDIADAIQTARQTGARILFDVDDLMFVPALAHAKFIDAIRFRNLDPDQVADYYGRVQAVMHHADLCLASTEEIAVHMRELGRPAIVLPNGFDTATWNSARLAARIRSETATDEVVRIGYAGGSLTHQRDFGLCADALAAVLRASPSTRLVLFRQADGVPLVDLSEFPALQGLHDRVEWRTCVAMGDMPAELARFDINIAPLEVGNPFCEAKSELKFFEAALADVPTVASPTGPFRRAIRDGETGFLAETTTEWTDAITRLVQDRALRRRIAAHAALSVVWEFGPERRAQEVGTILDLQKPGRDGAEAFATLARRRTLAAQAAELETEPAHRAEAAPYEIAFSSDRLGAAPATVVIPVYNYAHTVLETLESVAAQDLPDLDLVVVNDCSTDDSLDVVVGWVKQHATRFNRIVVARHIDNQGLGRTRNTGFALADTEWVMVLDADNRLLPLCLTECLRAARNAGAAFAYPLIRRFGEGGGLMGERAWDPVFLASGNYVDAMALVSRAAWAAVGGYDAHRTGWEDFDMWCNFAERGLWGIRVPGGPLAEYRVHDTSMIRTTMRQREKVRWMMQHLQRRHPWLHQLDSQTREPVEG